MGVFQSDGCMSGGFGSRLIKRRVKDWEAYVYLKIFHMRLWNWIFLSIVSLSLYMPFSYWMRLTIIWVHACLARLEVEPLTRNVLHLPVERDYRLSVYLSVSSSSHTTIHPSVCPPLRPYVCSSFCPSSYLSIHPSIHLALCLSACPSTCQSICHSVSQSDAFWEIGFALKRYKLFTSHHIFIR